MTKLVWFVSWKGDCKASQNPSTSSCPDILHMRLYEVLDILLDINPPTGFHNNIHCWFQTVITPLSAMSSHTNSCLQSPRLIKNPYELKLHSYTIRHVYIGWLCIFFLSLCDLAQIRGRHVLRNLHYINVSPAMFPILTKAFLYPLDYLVSASAQTFQAPSIW